MGYRWKKTSKGQYVDGHERDDVVWYQQTEFIPTMTALEHHTRAWILTHLDELGPLPHQQIVVIWFHDESTFYAHDRRELIWCAPDLKAVPKPKGEGVTIMIADFVSADYGWLRSRDGIRSARVVFKAGKAREGFFTNENIVTQAKVEMDILEADYTDEKHVFVYDNATTHRKREDDALSARHMPLNPSGFGKNGNSPNFGVYKNAIGPDGRTNTIQSLYFSADHGKYPGRFKGMAQILIERGYGEEAKLPRECPSFKCPPGSDRCCCRRFLYSQPDFVNEKSILEKVCNMRGFDVIFLPKFHPELNFIEQCWGAAKRVYRMYPPSSKEEDLENNVTSALDSVDVKVMRHFARRAWKFLDGYRQGLDGKQAAWAAKKYRGHRCLPDSILEQYGQWNS
ncbi:hypothetical protein K435DRAFT_683591 [Dendrothele bispora CBS 962.96]|uniref:Tc1-like transposase DDE domain-containing protein n=1 Tax=Dendrothele bispora (strain CBS 962.96) TaxID=1314807 RepID=A0A4S8LDK9_DENBC|nr:hypothetical protein K435DRAFT_683591 [Dendrothele bispora CBS 962.96]